MEPPSIIKSLILDKEELLKLAGVKFTTISEESSQGSSSEKTNNCFQVKLFPKPVSTCVEKASCCRIMAVESINRVNIEQKKIPNISKLNKRKNSGSTEKEVML
ncbi:unnamed protein product [Brachionus calyciflorus]|uniref:Uncharacterized protein n=1 Tax=Brachionus calyciflorus TaxID=104777 RepID=A0A814RDY9_9BILA|nr:unnamed protein product [Brachionus calyciflorus]